MVSPRTKRRGRAAQAVHKGKQVMERHWCVCCCCRCVWHFPKRWPRTTALIFGVVIPLWALLMVSLGLGVLLVQYESQAEIDGNDGILAKRAEFLLLEERAGKFLTVATVAENYSACVTEWVPQTNYTTLQNCVPEDIPRAFDPILNEFSEAFSSLRFNWNRAWPPEIGDIYGRGVWPGMVTEEVINASRPEAQEDQFTAAWMQHQQSLLEKYLISYNNTSTVNATAFDVHTVLRRSIQNATGGGTCYQNLGGTAWFFFTIMTTVGYGNQAPVTDAGRSLVAFAGIFALVLFGLVLGLAGHVILAIFDDFVRRFCCTEWLSYPAVGVLMWGSIWMIYAMAIGKDVEWWWASRLPDFYAGLEDPDADSVWFAYISTSTIGLGDFYLQPELMFIQDALKYSVVFTVGFVFLSTFFGKIAETLQSILPSRHNSLRARLKKTRLLACWKQGILPWETPEQQDKLNPDDYESPDDKALVERIGRFKEMLSPKEDGDHKMGEDGTDNAMANQSTNLDLIQQQEEVLRSLLEMSLAQKERAKVGSEMMAEPELEAFEIMEVDIEEEKDAEKPEAEAAIMAVEPEAKMVEPEPIVISCNSLMEGVIPGDHIA